MKKAILLILFCLSITGLMAQNQEIQDLLKQLDQTISERGKYMNEKESRMNELKVMLKQANLTDEQRYGINLRLLREYKLYTCDSSLKYLADNKRLAAKQKNKDWENETKIFHASVLSVMGMYKEALDLLNSIVKSSVTDRLKRDYFDIYAQVYDYLGEYASDSHYRQSYQQLNRLYRDSVYAVLKKEKINDPIVEGDRLITFQKWSGALDLLSKFFVSIQQEDHAYACAAFQLAYIYHHQNNALLRKKYLILSAISDTKAAIKENTSLRLLASMLFEEGDIDRSYAYIKYSLEDATFCNARVRTMAVTQTMTIIDKAYTLKRDKSRRQLILFLGLISALSVFLVISLVLQYRQMKKLSAARLELREFNDELHQMNIVLNEANEQQRKDNLKLKESNRIKEEYVGQFMNLCSSYIDKLEEYRKLVNRKVSAGQIEDLFKMTKSTLLIDTELKEFYKNFDSSFLQLFPSFVEEFNELLVPEERFVMKKGELLNTEMRIFALIRLGISDSFKIAKFLRYSSQTIYNYRTKVKNKALGSRDDFESNVLKIGSFVA